MANDVVAVDRLDLRPRVTILRWVGACAVVITVSTLLRRPMVIGVCARWGVMAVP